MSNKESFEEWSHKKRKKIIEIAEKNTYLRDALKEKTETKDLFNIHEFINHREIEDMFINNKLNESCLNIMLDIYWTYLVKNKNTHYHRLENKRKLENEYKISQNMYTRSKRKKDRNIQETKLPLALPVAPLSESSSPPPKNLRLLLQPSSTQSSIQPPLSTLNSTTDKIHKIFLTKPMSTFPPTLPSVRQTEQTFSSSEFRYKHEEDICDIKKEMFTLYVLGQLEE